jgi:MIP family channel proteins
MKGHRMFRRAWAEFIGTFGLVFLGTGAIVIDEISNGTISHVGVGIAFGLAVAAMIYAIGHISGAHINPAVTLGFALVRHFPWRHVPLYWSAQFAGAVTASILLRAMFGLVADLGATLPSGSAAQSLGLEIVLSFLLMFVIMAVATDVRAVGQGAAIAIGATVCLEAIMGGPVSGASMNPARSFAPALVTLEFASHWIYWIGPMVGMALAAAAYRLIREDGLSPHDATNGPT